MVALFLRPSRVLALALLGVAVAGFTGCASMDELKARENALDQAKADLARAERDLGVLRQQLDTLKAQLAERDAIINSLRGGNAENERLRARIAALEKQIKELSDQIQIPTVISDELAKLAEQYPDLLEYDPKTGMIRFKSDMTFDLGSTDVKARAREALGKLAGILNLPQIANNEVRIVGHTDDVPIKGTGPTAAMNPNNWYLSTNRANAVCEVLHSFGVNDTRTQPAGWGPDRPIAPNGAGRKGNDKNRRVEIYILGTKVPETAVSVPETPAGGGGHAPTAPRTTPVRRPVAAPATPATPAAPAVESTTPPVPMPH